MKRKWLKIALYSFEAFISRFKMYKDPNYVAPEVQKGDFQTVMPWNSYSGMSEEDLKAIYHYLMSLEPVDNEVVKSTSK